MIQYDLVPLSSDQQSAVKTMFTSEAYLLLRACVEAKARAASIDASNQRMEAAMFWRESQEKTDKKLKQASMSEDAAIRYSNALHCLDRLAENLDLATIKIQQ